MKKTCLILMIVLLLYVFSIPAYACTSFAVYSKKTYYGMNFDYPDVKFKFIINKYNDIKTLSLNMEYEKGVYGQVSGMNNAGLFTSNQIVLLEQKNIFFPDENILNMPELSVTAIQKYKSVADIYKYIEKIRLVNMFFKYSFHSLFADKHGYAMVVEVGDKNNLITKMQDNFIVMTNFVNSSLAGKTYDEATGAGADRYKKACEYIIPRRDKFSLNDGMEVLKRTAQGKEGGCPTQCSMVFDPGGNEVYVAVKNDFNKVWKISIDQETIEAFSGFKKHIKLKIGYNGITSDDLADPGKKTFFSYDLLLYFTACVLLVLVVVCLLFRAKKNVKKIVW